MIKAFLIFLIFFSHLCATSFDCDKATTDVEKSICSSSSLSKLDDKLSIKYNFIKKRISKNENNLFLKTQRQWLKERNQCGVSSSIEDCLISIYKDRISNFEVKYSKILFDYPSEGVIKNICASLAKNPKLFIQNHKLNTTIYKPNKFDINNDGIIEKVKLDKSGVRYSLDNDVIYPDKIGFNDDDRWAYQTLFLKFNGKIFGLYTYNYSYSMDTIKPIHITYINQANKEYLICRFDNKTIETMLPNKDIKISQELCPLIDTKVESTSGEFINYPSYLGTGKLKQIKLTKDSGLNSIYFQKTYTSSWSLFNNKEELFDYDNDGKQETIIEIEHSSTKGRMCDVIHFDEVVLDKNSSRKLLLKIQGLDINNSYPQCSTHSGFFKYKDMYYYEEIKDNKHNILQIRDNKISTICTGSFKTITSVKD